MEVKTKGENLGKKLELTQKQKDIIEHDNAMKLISKVEHVTITSESIRGYFVDGSSIECFYDGSYKKYDKNGTLHRSGGINSGNHLVGGHLMIQFTKFFRDKYPLNIERLIAIFIDYYNNELKDSYLDLEANVMDGSGSKYTADELNIMPDFSPDNLELCLKSKNASHGQLIRRLAYITGNVYRFSVTDLDMLYKLMDDGNPTGNYSKLKEYCEENLFKVR